MDFLNRKTGKWEKREGIWIPKNSEKSKSEIVDTVKSVDRIDPKNKTDQTTLKAAQKRLSGFLKFDLEDTFHQSSKLVICLDPDGDMPNLLSGQELREKEEKDKDKEKDKAKKAAAKTTSKKGGKAGCGC